VERPTRAQGGAAAEPGAADRDPAEVRSWLAGLDALMVLGVAMSPLFWGGMHPAGRVAWSGAVLGVWGLLALTRSLQPGLWRWPAVSLVMVGLAVWDLWLARVSLPALLESPTHALGRRLWGGVPAGLAPAHAPLHALQWLALAAAVHYGAARFSTTRRVRWAATAWGLALALPVALGTMHWATDASSLYGVWRPVQASLLHHPLAAPWVNPNQAGLAWALATVGALWLGARQTQRSAQVVWAVVAMGLGAGVVALEAWSALLALAATLVLLAAGGLTQWLLGRRAALRALAVVTGLTVAGAAAVAVIPTGWTTWVPEAARGTLSKVDRWHALTGLSLQAPWTGHGAGTTSALAQQVLPSAATSRVGHAESMVVELALSRGWLWVAALWLAWGVPVLRWVWQVTSRRRVHWRWLGISTLCLVGVESSAGMGLHALGLALPLALAGGAVLGMQAGQARPGSGMTPRRQPLLALMTMLGLTWLTLPGLVDSVRVELRPPAPALVARLASVADSEEAAARVAVVQRQSPLDPALLYAAALVADADGQTARVDQLAGALQTLAPWSALTARLQVARALRAGEGDSLCQPLALLVGVHHDRLRWRPLAPHMAAWAPCLLALPHRGRDRMYQQLDDQRLHALAFQLASLDLDSQDTADGRTPPLERAVSLWAFVQSAHQLGLSEVLPWRVAQLQALSLNRAPWPARVGQAVGWVQPPDPPDLTLPATRGPEALREPAAPLPPERVVQRMDLALDMAGGAPDLAPADLRTLLVELAAMADHPWATPHDRQRWYWVQARIAVALEDWARAGAAADGVLTRHPHDLPALRLRARIATEAGDPATALRHWQTLLDYAPDDREARQALQQGGGNTEP
jgi:hypothetical protein